MDITVEGTLTREEKYDLAVMCIEVFSNVPDVVSHFTTVRDDNAPT